MRSFTIIIAFLFIMMSCEKENSFENQELIEETYTLIAGDVFNDSVIYHEFDPYISVKGKRKGVDTNYVYNDSAWIDLNNDNIDDIYFEFYRSHFQPSCDCEGIDCCMPSDELFCIIRTKSNVEVAIEKSHTYDLPIKFSIGDSIDNRYNWLNFETSHNLALVGLSSGWNTDSFNSFLGLRINTNNDTMYSWIRINTHYLNSIDIYDYAIEK